MTVLGIVGDFYMTIIMSVLLIFSFLLAVMEFSGFAKKMPKKLRKSLHIIMYLSAFFLIVGIFLLGQLGFLGDIEAFDPVQAQATFGQMAILIFAAVTFPLLIFALYVITHK